MRTEQTAGGRGLAWILDRLLAVLVKTGLSPDFLRFGIVGTLGFCWDTATVYALRHALGLYLAGAVSFIVAATANWALNRVWTFRHLDHGAMHRQWAKFMVANSIGFVINRGLYFFLIWVSPLCHRDPIIGIVAGSFGGLAFNYFLSKKFVFK